MVLVRDAMRQLMVVQTNALQKFMRPGASVGDSFVAWALSSGSSIDPQAETSHGKRCTHDPPEFLNTGEGDQEIVALVTVIAHLAGNKPEVSRALWHIQQGKHTKEHVANEAWTLCFQLPAQCKVARLETNIVVRFQRCLRCGSPRF